MVEEDEEEEEDLDFFDFLAFLDASEAILYRQLGTGIKNRMTGA